MKIDFNIILLIITNVYILYSLIISNASAFTTISMLVMFNIFLFGIHLAAAVIFALASRSYHPKHIIFVKIAFIISLIIILIFLSDYYINNNNNNSVEQLIPPLMFQLTQVFFYYVHNISSKKDIEHLAKTSHKLGYSLFIISAFWVLLVLIAGNALRIFENKIIYIFSYMIPKTIIEIIIQLKR
jgi:hypothetical protein